MKTGVEDEDGRDAGENKEKKGIKKGTGKEKKKKKKEGGGHWYGKSR